MKLSTLIILLVLSGTVLAQNAAVTKNANNNQLASDLVVRPGGILGFSSTSQLLLGGAMHTYSGSGDDGKVRINSPGPLFNGVDGMLTIKAQNNHAVVARTPNPTDGIALVGWSSSGAPAAKLLQDTYFNSPALTVWRNLSSGITGFDSSPGVLVASYGPTHLSTTQKAIQVMGNGTANFHITWTGFATSRDKPLMRFHGRLSTAPAGTYGTDYAAGDLYFNTSDSKFYCHDGASWKAM